MSNVTEVIQTAVMDKVNYCLTKILGDRANDMHITVAYRTDMGTTAGLAYRIERRIELNEILLLANIDKFIQTTVPHEVAHILQLFLFRSAKQPHGPEWKRIMNALGVVASTYHSYDVSLVRNRPTFRYVCGCEGVTIQLSKIIHNKMQKGEARWCRICKSRAVYFPEGD